MPYKQGVLWKLCEHFVWLCFSITVLSMDNRPKIFHYQRVGRQKPYNLTTNMLKAYIVYLPSLLFPPLFVYFLVPHPYISFHFEWFFSLFTISYTSWAELVQFGSKLGQLISFNSKLCSFWVQTSVSHFHYM